MLLYCKLVFIEMLRGSRMATAIAAANVGIILLRCHFPRVTTTEAANVIGSHTESGVDPFVSRPRIY
jgi:hypothetical protein